MKYCQKCGKELFDEAVFCPGCGCPTVSNQPTNPIYSNDYPKIREFSEKVKSIYTISLVGTILCLGIGIIFAIIAWVKLKALSIPPISSINPNEIAEFDAAKRKLRTCLTLSTIPAIVLFFWALATLASAFIMLDGIGGALIFCIISWLIWFWGASCIKNLHAELK